jgi:hypothetical protein
LKYSVRTRAPPRASPPDITRTENRTLLWATRPPVSGIATLAPVRASALEVAASVTVNVAVAE